MYSEYTINGRTIPIIDTGNAMLVGLWDLAREMGWGNGLETLEPLVRCDHAGSFKVIFFDCRQMRRIRKKPNPWLTG